MATAYPSDGFFKRNQVYRCKKNHTNYHQKSFIEGELYIYESTGYERYDDLFLIRFFPEKHPGNYDKAVILFVKDIHDKETISLYFDIE